MAAQKRQFAFPERGLEVDAHGTVSCLLRKKRVLLQPEEYVRQQLLLHLVHDLGCPVGLLACERALTYNGLSKRFDVLLFNQQGQPLLLIETKRPEDKGFAQAARQLAVYNQQFQAPFLALTNGLELYSYALTSAGYVPGRSIPPFKEMLALAAKLNK